MSNWHDAIQASDLLRGGDVPAIETRCSRCGRWFAYDSDTGLCETCESEDEVPELDAAAHVAPPK